VTRKLAALNWLFGVILLALAYHFSQMKPPPPTEADPDGVKVLLFFVYVFSIDALFNIVIGTGLWFRSPGLWRVTFWVAILAILFSGPLAFFVTVSRMQGMLYLPFLLALVVPVISAFHLYGLIHSSRRPTAPAMQAEL
jgi:hypothetical protein